MPQFLPAARVGIRSAAGRPLRLANSPVRIPHLGLSTTAALRASIPRQMAPKPEPMMSHRILAKQEQHLPDDMGLMQDTFVMPTGKNRPSILKDPKERVRLRWTRMLMAIRNTREWMLYWWNVKGPHKIFEPKKLVADLHQDMYEAFARGDQRQLAKVCGRGLMSSFIPKLMTRPKGQKMEWRLHKYLAPIKMVSNRAHWYVDMGFSRRQAVFRIHSTQSLTKYDAKGNVVPGTGEPKEVVEYVVLEQMKLPSRPLSHWYVWGTTEETTKASQSS